MATILLALTLASLIAAEQPAAAKPIEAPQRSLHIGQLNFLQTTDIHGWNAGHVNEGQYSADFGDYISFTQRMRTKTDAAGADLLLIDNGDRIDGNGLYDGSKPKGLYIYDIVKQLNYDVVIMGNHELRSPETVDYEYSKLATQLNKTYLASNIDYIHSETGEQVPFARRYRVFRTKNQGIKVAAFGFMFNILHNANNSVVQPVEKAVMEEWFQTAIREKVDLFLVCGHIPLDTNEFKVIVEAIRRYNKKTPIQIFGAHSHIRNFVKYDSRAYGLQSGRYMETVGWGSIDGLQQDTTQVVPQNVSYKRTYIDNNILAYHFHTGLNASTFPTDHGKNVSLFIQKARSALDLDQVYGCIPKDLYVTRAKYPSSDSILSWITQSVFRDIILKRPEASNTSSLMLFNTGFIRYDLIKGNFTRDTTFIVSPFINKLKHIENVSYEVASHIFSEFNDYDSVSYGENLSESTPSKKLTAPRQSRITGAKTVYRDAVPSTESQIFFAKDTQRPFKVPGYTTVDDFGSDGDDTIHETMPTYAIPNVIKTEMNFPSGGDPQVVDLIFIEFLEPLVLRILNNTGVALSNDNVKDYREETINDLIIRWVSENWPGRC